MNADLLSIIADLGDDLDLLLTPDAWLESERIRLQQNMAIIAGDLDNIMKAQSIKRNLQQQNFVAMRSFEPSETPTLRIKICSLPIALGVLDDERANANIPNDVSRDNTRQHLQVWENDGYDIKGAKRLRRYQV